MGHREWEMGHVLPASLDPPKTPQETAQRMKIPSFLHLARRALFCQGWRKSACKAMLDAVRDLTCRPMQS
jgi:hypothetical protein